MEPSPTQFEAGIFLEKSRQLVPWGCSRAEALAIPGANHYLVDDDAHIQWTDEVFGLLCRVRGCLSDDSKLDSVLLDIGLAPDRARKGPYYHSCLLFEKLAREYGQPLVQATNGKLDAPILTWKQNGCYLQLYMGESPWFFTVLEITHGKLPRYSIR